MEPIEVEITFEEDEFKGEEESEDDGPPEPELSSFSFCSEEEPASEVYRHGQTDEAKGHDFRSGAGTDLKRTEANAGCGGHSNQNNDQKQDVDRMDGVVPHALNTVPKFARSATQQRLSLGDFSR